MGTNGVNCQPLRPVELFWRLVPQHRQACRPPPTVQPLPRFSRQEHSWVEQARLRQPSRRF